MCGPLPLLLAALFAAPALGGDTVTGAALSEDGASAFLCAQTSLKSADRLYRLTLPPAGGGGGHSLVVKSVVHRAPL
jgi:hypothetical protein